jgi:hypothetical protein
MESVGLAMYIWETSGDERVRPSHEMMDGGLCRWDNSAVYSQDGGKTWILRPSGAVILHPGQNYQCRCCAIAYWQELVDEADEQIDLLSISVDNIPGSGSEGFNIMNPPKVQTKNVSLMQKQEAREQHRREQNAQKAREAADELFPGEEWKKVEDGIYLSPHKPIGEKSGYKEEIRDAKILHSFGSTVYLVPDDSRAPGNKYDAIVNGLKMEFKNVGGNANTLQTQFLKSRSQAPNVFINLEESKMTKREIITALYGARNNPRYAIKNKFKGGRIILKIKGQNALVYLNVDNLKLSGQ